MLLSADEGLLGAVVGRVPVTAPLSEGELMAVARVAGRCVRNGLVDSLSPDAAAFLWDQCVVSSNVQRQGRDL